MPSRNRTPPTRSWIADLLPGMQIDLVYTQLLHAVAVDEHSGTVVHQRGKHLLVLPMFVRVLVRGEEDATLVEPKRDGVAPFELQAEESRLSLGPDHWPVLHFMRAYWTERQVTPDVRHVFDFLVETEGFEKKAAKEHLFHLFPYGYMQQGCKIAGMQRPRAWSTG